MLPTADGVPRSICAFSASDTTRYSRQLVLKSFGVSRQKKLLESRVLVVGAGGLGSSVLIHLVASGVGCGDNGRIGIIDDDIVSLTNLHRQILYSEEAAMRGVRKIDAAKERLLSINSNARIKTYFKRFGYFQYRKGQNFPSFQYESNHQFKENLSTDDKIYCLQNECTTERIIVNKIHSSKNKNRDFLLSDKNYEGVDIVNSSIKDNDNEREESEDTIVGQYDLVIDATDNAMTRYLINDACVRMDKPLVSGAALGQEGQVCIYNKNHGPCYRCLYPTPLPAEASKSCSDNGVLGVIPGIIGSLQALEAINILSQDNYTEERGEENKSIDENKGTSLLCFSGDFSPSQFHRILTDSKDPECLACSSKASLRSMKDSIHWCMSNDLQNMEMSCKSKNNSEVLENSVSCSDYASQYMSSTLAPKDHILLDVRDSHQYEICHLDTSYNIPYNILHNLLSSSKMEDFNSTSYKLPEKDKIIFVICRRGILSSQATKELRANGYESVYNIKGGLTLWQTDVDPSLALY